MLDYNILTSFEDIFKECAHWFSCSADPFEQTFSFYDVQVKKYLRCRYAEADISLQKVHTASSLSFFPSVV